MEPSEYSKIKKFVPGNYEHLLSGRKVSLRAPLGFFPQSEKSMQYRLLNPEGDGLGGISLSDEQQKELEPKYKEASQKKKTLWVVIEGELEQYVTEDQLNRHVEPDAIFSESKIVGTYEAEMHEFPKEEIEK